jgi:hypothetical protein
MQTTLTQAILAFNNRTGSNGCPSKHFVEALCGSGTYSRLQDSADYISTRLKNHFNCDHLDFVPMDSGTESLVMDCNNQHILKLRPGIQHRDSVIPPDILLPPVLQDYNKRLNVSFEVFPKAKIDGITPQHIKDMKTKCWRAGYYFIDDAPQNMGFISRDNKEEPIIIDSGAVFSFAHPALYYQIAKRIGGPIYRQMPFIHPHWRKLKITLNDMLHGSTQHNASNKNKDYTP